MSDYSRMNNKELHEAKAKLTAEAKKLASDETNWTPQVEAKFDAHMADIKVINKTLDNRMRIQGGPVTSYDDPQDFPTRQPKAKKVAGNEDVVLLGRGESAAEAFGSTVPHGLGEFVRAMVLGPNANGIAPEVSAALGGSLGTAGGYTVPTELSAGVLDLARAKSVLSRAGASVGVMTSNEMTMARLTSDPTMQVKIENAEFDEANITFGALVFRPLLIGAYVSMSRELAEDSVNFSATIEETLSRALAVQLDKMPIQGAPAGGTPRIGMIDDTEIDHTGSVGTLEWADLITATTAIRGENHEPNAVIIHPTKRDPLLNTVTGGSGEYLGIPPSLDGVAMLDTTNIPAANVLVGDFTKLLWVFRSGPLIEATTQGNGTFKKHQVAIKITWRGDYGVLYPEAFYRLSGIS